MTRRPLWTILVPILVVFRFGPVDAELANPGFEQDFSGWERNSGSWPQDRSAVITGDTFATPPFQNKMAVLGTPAWGSTDFYPGRIEQSFTLDSPRLSVFLNVFTEDAESWDLTEATLYDSGGNPIKDISLHAGDIQVLAGNGFDAYEARVSTGWVEWVFSDLDAYLGQRISLILTAGQTDNNDDLTPPDIAIPGDGEYSTWAYFDAPVGPAGTGTLAGTVSDAATGMAMEARVAAINTLTAARVLTQSDPVTGAYSFAGLTAGTYQVVCFEKGHRLQRTKDQVWPGKTTRIDCALKSKRTLSREPISPGHRH